MKQIGENGFPLFLPNYDCLPFDIESHVHVRPGLIVYLAHIGSFVPAEAATIGIVRHLHTRIQSSECVASHMSAFLIDLKQVREHIYFFYVFVFMR